MTGSTTLTTISITTTPTTNRRSLSLLREVGIAVGLFVVWQYLVWLKGRHTPVGAITRGRTIFDAERMLHIDVETWTQHVTRPLWTALNDYYSIAHVAVMAAFVGYLIARHRDYWRAYRLILFTTTFVGLAIQFVWASAPPRFINRGIIDTANVGGFSVYHAAGNMVDQYSTFPSLHVAWAAIISYIGYRIGGRLKYVWAFHLPATVLVVIATGNHFILDCVFGVVLMFFSTVLWRRSLHPNGLYT